ncbi:MAG: hypothetical protein ACTSV6_05935 [Candidatus Heimdallarchaeota archaeon]
MPRHSWERAQHAVASFFKQHYFATQEEVRLPSGKRIDIIARKKFHEYFLHILVEVKDWEKVTRKQESQFCNQIIDYLIEYSLTTILKPYKGDKWHRSEKRIHDRFLGILCLTKNAHFSFRKVSDHFIRKNKEIQGIPIREQIAQQLTIYVARFDFLTNVFHELQIPFYKEPPLSDWFVK